MDDACREIGFLVIAGHGVAQAQVDEMQHVTRAFFDLPYWEKLRVKMPPDRYRGLMTVGSEDVAYSMDADEGAPDWRESFVTGPHDHAYDDYHYGPKGWRFFAANLWPDRPAEMRPLWEAYYREMERLAGDLMRIFACALRLPEEFFVDKIDRHITNFIASYYPPQPTRRCRGSSAAGPMRTTAASPSSRRIPRSAAFRCSARTAPGPTCPAFPAPSSSISAT